MQNQSGVWNFVLSYLNLVDLWVGSTEVNTLVFDEQAHLCSASSAHHAKVKLIEDKNQTPVQDAFASS